MDIKNLFIITLRGSRALVKSVYGPAVLSKWKAWFLSQGQIWIEKNIDRFKDQHGFTHAPLRRQQKKWKNYILRIFISKKAENK